MYAGSQLVIGEPCQPEVQFAQQNPIGLILLLKRGTWQGFRFFLSGSSEQEGALGEGGPYRLDDLHSYLCTWPAKLSHLSHLRHLPGLSSSVSQFFTYRLKRSQARLATLLVMAMQDGMALKQAAKSWV
jgi:hypothetical protein